MKMKEVTEQTGLTERTVRYYMEKGLIAPHGQCETEGNIPNLTKRT